MAETTEATSFFTYLKTNIPHHLKLVGIVLAIVFGVSGFNYVRDLRAELENQQKITATLSQQFQAIGAKAVTANSQGTVAQVDTAATAAFGSQVMGLMASEGAKINSLTSAVGMTNATVSSLAAQLPQFTVKQQTITDGALTGYAMEEARKDGPPLSSVNLFYDPTQRDPNKAFAGTSWTHYQEQFQTSTGDWVKQKDGGFKTTVTLSRTVSKPDPNDPTKLVPVGTESIPITGATTLYTPQGLLEAGDFKVPRWELGLGLYKQKDVGTVPYGHLDYRVTDRYGVFVGAVNNGLIGGVSIRLDTKK